MPLVLNPAKIIELLHCAEPFFSKYFIGFKFLDPIMVNGRFLLLFNLKAAPNLLKGSDTLLKSLFDKLLSPLRLYWVVCIN